MSQPTIRKNSDGTWTIEGVQERNVSQLQADYLDVIKASQLVTGQQGEAARKLIVNNPEMSGGLLSSLASYGAVPNNDLVKALSAIDAQTRAQRELDAFKEAQRISTEKFNNTWYGNLWSYVKGAVRGSALVGMAPFEFISGWTRNLKRDFDVATDGGTPESATTSKYFKDILNQVTLTQVGKDLITQKKINLGAGFFPSEETGAGFAARRAKLDMNAVTVKIGDRTYKRPFSIFDPVVNVITAGNADTGYGSIMSAIGDLLFGIKTDTFIVAGKIRQGIKEAERVARTSSGMKAAKAYQQKALLDAQLEEISARVNKAKQEMDAAIGLERSAKQDEFLKALDEQVQKADEYDNIYYDPEKIAGFLSGSMAAPAIDALADISDWKQIWRLGKQRGGRKGFNVEQSKAIAAATTREEVLNALAPYIAKGEVAADILDTGTATGKVVKQILNSRIVPGKVAQVVESVKGLGARGIRKMPWYNKVVEAYNKGLTVVPQGKAIHASDKDALIDAIYSYGRITNVAQSKLDELADIVAMTDDASEAGFTASGKLFDEIYKANINNPGIDKDLLEQVTRIFRNGRAEMGSYWAQRHAAGAKLNYIMTGGKKVTISGPHLDSEYLNSVVYFPDARELLDTISIVNKIKFAGKSVEKVKEELDLLTNVVWKRIVLVRPAYILRNIAEEQIRVLGTGHVSFFNNPVMAMGMWLGRDNGPKWRALLNKFDPFKQTVMGENFKLGNAAEELLAEELAHDVANSYVKFMTDRAASGFDSDVRSAMTFAGFIPREFGHPRWWEGLANEIRILSNSIAGRVVARTGMTQDNQLAAVEYLLRGGGKKEWNQFTSLQKPEIRDWLRSDDGAMAYLFTGTDENGRAVSLLARIEEATGRGGEGSQALKDLIAYGKINKEGFRIEVPKGKQSAENSIRNAAQMAENKKQIKDINQEFAEVLRQNFDGTGNWDGILMNIPEASFKKYRKEGGLFTNISDWFFDKAVALEKTSTMGPEWRQSYWDAIYDVSGALDADAVASLSKVAKNSLTPLQNWKGVQIGSKHPVWKAFQNAKGDGNLTAKEAHEYASAVANKRVAELFYDASRRRLVFHQLRILAPFANAWEDTIRKWGEISLDNPLQVYKIQKSLQWLAKPESSALYSMTDAKDYYDPNQGFFFNDPLDGQRKFFIPFLGTGLNFLSNITSGQGMSTQGPYAISATPQSLNFAFASGSIMPGVGPGLQMSLLVLDKLGINPINIAPIGMRDGIAKIVYPFGEPDLSQGIIEGFLPGNWRRILAGVFPNQEQTYAAAFAPVMNYLASGGNYDLNDMEDQGQLIKDTNKFAQWFTLFRGLFGMTSPFPLQPQAVTTLDDGNVVLSTALYNDFKQLELNNGGDFNKGYADFLDLYGPEAIFAIINTSAGAPTNLMTYELIQREPGVVDAYPDTYGYAYPNGGFSAEMYRWQRRAGNKDKFTPEELIQRATSIRYYAANDRLMSRLISGDLSETEYEEAKKSLTDTYVAAGLKLESDPYKNARVKEQLRRMASDSRFAGSDAVDGLRDYLYLRDKALEAAGIDNDSLAKQSAQPQRIWLAQQAKEILNRNPEFYKFYYTFFKKELQDK